MIHANQVRSLFLDGHDTHEIARRFSISEGMAYNLLQKARTEGFQVKRMSRASLRRGQIRGALRSANVTRKAPITLASVSILRDEP